ncbi:MAG: hypothetical protein ACRC5T_11180 [Cetobacterium sp.]
MKFYIEAVKDEEKTIEEGRSIFVDREYIKIIPVGDKNTVVCRPVKTNWDGGTPPDSERWTNLYTAFKNQQMQVTEGTPLNEWAVLSKSQVEMMKAANVHTVEQLTQVSDNNLNNLGMGARVLRDKAVAFLQQAKDGSSLNKYQDRVEVLEKQIEALTNQLKGFSDASPAKKKR